MRSCESIYSLPVDVDMTLDVWPPPPQRELIFTDPPTYIVKGPLFGSIGGGVASPVVKLRIANLTDYIKSIQMN